MIPLSAALLDTVLDTVLVAAPLLDPVPAPGDVKPGIMAVVLFVGLVVVTVMLWFSMRKQIRKIRFTEEPDDRDDAPSDPAAPEDGRGPEAGQR